MGARFRLPHSHASTLRLRRVVCSIVIVIATVAINLAIRLATLERARPRDVSPLAFEHVSRARKHGDARARRCAGRIAS